MKPKLFIASSVEGLNVAYTIQTNLEHDVDTTVWPQGVFNLSEMPLDSLLKELDEKDFGVFVFSPDDTLNMRGENSKTVRDNVVFELGLFIGKLGKQRCFIVKPNKSELHLPTDLAGVTPATYDSGRNDLLGALGPACHKIRLAIQNHGIVQPENSRSGYNEKKYRAYDVDDIHALLSSWLTPKNSGAAITFKEIDEKLGFEPGTSKKYLPELIRKTPNFSVLNEGSNVVRFMYKQPVIPRVICKGF